MNFSSFIFLITSSTNSQSILNLLSFIFYYGKYWWKFKSLGKTSKNVVEYRADIPSLAKPGATHTRLLVTQSFKECYLFKTA